MSGFGKQNTRAQVSAAAERHPEATGRFREGLGSVFRQWTALELAVMHQWGGSSSAARADALVDEVMAMFMGPEKIYKDDISLVLEDYLETQFSTICEDGSPDELGELLCLMWRKCGEGDFALVTDIMGKETVRREVASRCQGLEAGDAIDSDEEEEEEGGGGGGGGRRSGGGGGGGAMEGIEEGDEEEEVAPPRVDADGWETVARGKKAGGGGGGKRR